MHEPCYVGLCNASSHGAGSIWFAGVCPLPPIVWCVQWPDDICHSIVSFANPSGSISNSNLEMAGMLLLYLVLEHLAPLQHIHVAAWCDNTPTMSWTNKLSASKSPIAGCLTQALAMCIHVNKASPLTSHSKAGINNQMADVASQTFHHNTASNQTFAIHDDNFLHLFNSTFPLTGHLLVQLLPQLQVYFTHLLRTKRQCINAGIMAVNHKERQHYWNHWTKFIESFSHREPMLTTTPINQQNELLTTFAEHVCTSNCGQQQQVRASTIQVAICAIGKTFEMDGCPNPLYHAKGRYWLPLEYHDDIIETLKSLVINYPRAFFYMTPAPYPIQRYSAGKK